MLWRTLTRPIRVPCFQNATRPLITISAFAQWRCFTESHSRLKSGKKSKKGKNKKTSLFTPSAEQLEIARLCAAKNVIVSARPGSGKTATLEAIVAAYPDKTVLCVTYSKRLQLESTRRTRKYSNCKVVTFHALASLLFDRVVFKDTDLEDERRRVDRSGQLPSWTLRPVDIFILDEFQDCTGLLFWLTVCFMRANAAANGGRHAQIVVLGDERQSIFQFRGADHRYLTLAHEILGPASPYPFTRASLKNSFRLSQETVRFISDGFLGGKAYIESNHSGPKPIIIRYNHFASGRTVGTLLPLIKKYGAKNTAIIAPSVRTKGLLQDIVNDLSDWHNVPIAVPIDDDQPLNDKVIADKLCVSTIHQFKGSERDLVILLNIDSRFFRFFARNVPDDRCPNSVFVALTRAKKQLVLLHDDSAKMMPFVSIDAVQKTAEIINITNTQEDFAPPDRPSRLSKHKMNPPTKVNVRAMTRFADSVSLMDIIQQHLCVRTISPSLPSTDHIDMPGIVPSDAENRFYESVSDINGNVVVAAFEHHFSGTLNSLGLDKKTAASMSGASLDVYIPWMCRQACEYEARMSGYVPRLNQMKDHAFDWIAHGNLELAQSRLETEIQAPATQKLEVEKPCNRTIEIHDEENDEVKTVDIYGRTDVVATFNGHVQSIWEVKCVSELSVEHIVQAALYAYLCAASGKVPRTILYNVRDGETLEITAVNGKVGLERLVESVIRLRYTDTEELSHERMKEMCEKMITEVLKLK